MDHNPPPLPRPLDYSAGAHRVRRPVTSIRQTLVLLGITVILMVELTFVVPRLMTAYRDFNIELPALTRLTVGASEFVRSNPFSWAILISIPLFVPMLTTQLTYSADSSPAQFRLRRFLLGSLVTMLFGLIAVVFAIGMILPYFSMIDSLTNPSK